MSDEEQILAYSEAGHIPGNAAWWPAGGRWHEVCAYCRSEMSDQGKFHRNAHCIIPDIPGNTVGFCMECGGHDAIISPTESRVRDGEMHFKPRDKSPGAACLVRVADCPTCGWWYAIERADGWANGGDPLAYHGILRAFDLSAATVPIEILRSELPRQLEKIGSLHPNRMEDLVGAVLAGAYDCEVRSLGYSKDGGTDLLVLKGDVPVAVQVKRRRSPSKTEGVSGVREFLGAALLQGHRRLLHVTTADHYSTTATEAAMLASRLGLVSSYELVDIHLLKELLDAQPGEATWRIALGQAVRRHFTMIPTIDPYEIG